MATQPPLDRVQLVIFRLGETEFGVPVEQVRRIERLKPVTRVPRAPRFLEGVTNIQGEIVPVVDLKKRLALSVGPYDDQARLVVVNLGEQVVGMMVDAVREILWLPVNQIEPPPEMIAEINGVYLTGVGRLGERLIILLSLAQVLTVQEVAELSQVG